MMCYYKSVPYEECSYGIDFQAEWFEKKKPELIKINSCINLPYILDGDKVITQSNTCMLYLGKSLGIDSEGDALQNHTVLDQVMDWRNDLMKVVYPFTGVTKEGFAEAANKHLAGSTKTSMTKLEGFCKGTYMCGSAPRSGDFHVFEMLDQHIDIAAKVDAPDIFTVGEGFPKLKALHAAFKDDPKLAAYFQADCYKNWSQNNVVLTHFTGQPEGFVYGTSKAEMVTFK